MELTGRIVKLTEKVRDSISVIGDFMLFGLQILRTTKGLWKRRNLFFKHCEMIGVSSSGVVLTAALFMGGVLGYQLYAAFHMFGAEALLGGSVGISLFRELAPVMAAIMVTGRSGAAMAAEIASMRITEQIDALEVMAINPVEYLVTPRVMASLMMMPLLSVFFASVGSLAAAFVSCEIMGLSYATYWQQFTKVVDALDLQHCVIKGAVFGLVLAWVGCFCGYFARGGARGVGLATRTTVVATCLTILLSDYVITSFLPLGYEKLSIN